MTPIILYKNEMVKFPSGPRKRQEHKTNGNQLDRMGEKRNQDGTTKKWRQRITAHLI
jgi:hypothetical protein